MSELKVRKRYLGIAIVAAVAVSGVSVAFTANAQASGDGIAWHDCPASDKPQGDVECATITVPLDWSQPHGDTVDIALARRQATDPDHRVGSLLTDPGGPGGSGVRLLEQGTVFTDKVNARFDTVSFDPRGVNASTPIKCDADLVARAKAAMLPTTAEQYDAAVSLTREVADNCRKLTGPLYDHVDNRSVVRDIDAIRAALGEKKLNYVGYSYGTLMGQQYAERFPKRIRAMVMDGNMDHSITSTWEQTSSQVGALEGVFDDFADWCDGDTACALHGMGTRDVYGKLRERAKAGTLTDPHTGAAIDFSAFTQILASAVRPNAWVELSRTYLALRDHKGEMSVKAKSASAEMNLPDQAMWCQDWDLPVHGYGDWKHLKSKLAKRYPNTQWTPNLNMALICAGYPGPTTNPQAKLDIHGAPPLVMLGNIHDHATVYSWTRAAAEQSGAHLITYEGYGHTIYAYGRKSACVNDAVDDYLINLTVPAEGLSCPGVEKPGAATGADATSPGSDVEF
ncbi:MAG TPA: alpha/beta hydrolase [Stackebrandtia sp.]|uniref:alpha/beta hydrolase n=1 Tax=Stackebrandtia sp. TaxID=2023065 RepID=UPI002D6A1ED1|nr:alpha/beta hydrolase [Stackebrandtia sp.]HZE39090.1 alpha/beta hydrolase [Stackebrandtia sp.]